MYSSVAILQTLYKKVNNTWQSTPNIIYYLMKSKDGMGTIGDIALRDALITISPTFRVGIVKM